MDEQNVFQNGFEAFDSKDGIVDKDNNSTASETISNSLSGLCIPKQGWHQFNIFDLCSTLL